jgi:hypothetical protein
MWWFAEWPQAGATNGTAMLRGEGPPRPEVSKIVLSAGGFFRVHLPDNSLVVVRPRKTEA